MLSSNPITSEQLAERKRRVCEEMGPNSFVASLTGEQWDHIIVCLREHESRAAIKWSDSEFESLAISAGRPIAQVISSGEGLFSWSVFSVGGVALGRDAAKAAVEKAVRNG